MTKKASEMSVQSQPESQNYTTTTCKRWIETDNNMIYNLAHRLCYFIFFPLEEMDLTTTASTSLAEMARDIEAARCRDDPGIFHATINDRMADTMRAHLRGKTAPQLRFHTECTRATKTLVLSSVLAEQGGELADMVAKIQKIATHARHAAARMEGEQGGEDLCAAYAKIARLCVLVQSFVACGKRGGEGGEAGGVRAAMSHVLRDDPCLMEFWEAVTRADETWMVAVNPRLEEEMTGEDAA